MARSPQPVAARLGRSYRWKARDWHTRLEFCGIVGCPTGNQPRLHDPATVDDRVFLGMRGSFVEAELALFGHRSRPSRLALAAHGELFTQLLVGCERVGLRRAAHRN